jgi:aspartate carbamoyltransferase catalytic subunit
MKNTTRDTKKLKHVLDSKQFRDRKFLDDLFRAARGMEKACLKGSCPQSLRGKIMATLFYEPSTRTRLSFESAMLKLGGSVIGTENASEFSSAFKGESLKDTIRIVQKYADVIVIRHPEEGSARRAAEASEVPVINAGDGPGQHPTQMLLDMYTINKEKGRVDDLGVAAIGDLLYGRTTRSLVYMLSHMKGIGFTFVSPERLRFSREFLAYLDSRKVKYVQTDCLDDALGSDVLYMTRIQKERFSSEDEYNKYKGCYVLDKSHLARMNKDAIVMHPLPRVGEISTGIDSDPRAAYFRQAENGLYVRMALLNMILGE